MFCDLFQFAKLLGIFQETYNPREIDKKSRQSVCILNIGSGTMAKYLHQIDNLMLIAIEAQYDANRESSPEIENKNFFQLLLNFDFDFEVCLHGLVAHDKGAFLI